MKPKMNTMFPSKFSLKSTGISIYRAHHSSPPTSSLSAPRGKCFNNLIIPVDIMAKNSSKASSSIPKCIHTPITPSSFSPSIPSLPTTTIPQSYFPLQRHEIKTTDIILCWNFSVLAFRFDYGGPLPPPQIRLQPLSL